MSMQLKVNEKEYTVTYKFKAMYDSEFIKEMFETFNNMNSEDDNSGIEMFAYLAQKTTNMLLVGLQEEHSQEFKTFDDAMDLIQKYFTENEDNQDINMLGLYTELINTMSEEEVNKISLPPPRLRAVLDKYIPDTDKYNTLNLDKGMAFEFGRKEDLKEDEEEGEPIEIEEIKMH